MDNSHTNEYGVFKLSLTEKKEKRNELKEFSAKFLGKEGNYTLTYWKNFIKHCDIFVALYNKKIVGFLMCAKGNIYQFEQIKECMNYYKFIDTETINVMLFAVDSAHRKKHIGTMLFDLMNLSYNDTSHNNFILAMRKNNVIAKSFYLKQNFIETSFILKSAFESPVDDQIILIKKI